ncbi:Extracellular basic protease [Calidithermus terrae]|uniref:Extracellular basic protease n=1 Tax=Calidithermus terrae TaxID=1408545 RepID=A0A399EMA4_9DEIN|nr:S8 family peptidase [Calidithermus terrae]RIH83582.1 Extracellular basic protease [Calidithermus terrae]
MQMYKWIGAVAVLGLLAACNPNGGGDPNPPENLEISGQVGLDTRALRPEFGVGAMTQLAAQSDFVPGELIVKFRPGAALRPGATLAADGFQLGLVRDLALENTQLVRAAVQDKQATLELLQRLKGRSDVVYAQLNYVRHAFKTPNDEFYSYQWHYPAMNLPQAWDLETGASNPVTVAVIDTGILSGHPDFQGKLLPGYDFISDPANANDGNGRDNNPEDPGDEPGGQGSYHGAHVAGTVAAATNEGVGGAGVSWGAKIVPVRVLGVQGGTDADILDSVLWSAGISVSGVPANPNPAHVINMSLGGSGKCADVPAWQDAFNKASAKGSIIVVAAGNQNSDANDFVPASCTGIITVGATETRNYRAPYSNYGSRIDVMAPGGDTKNDRNGDGYVDGVLSAARNDQSGNYNWVFYQGTSMASPHVAGLVALMKSKKPSLTYQEALSVLKQTARPLDATACQRATGADCGAGLVDAVAALQALGGGNPTPDFSLSVTAPDVQLAPGGSASLTVNLNRSGGFANSVTFSLSGAPTGLTGSFNPGSTAGNSTTLNLSASSSLAPGSYTLTVQGSSGGLSRNATVNLVVAAPPSLKGTQLVACYYLASEDACDEGKSQVLTLSKDASSAAYRFSELKDGKYVVYGWKDTNKNGKLDDGDYLGFYTEDGEVVLVRPSASDIDFSLGLVSGERGRALERVRSLMR